MIDYDRDVDLPAINKIVAFCFSIDVAPLLLGPRPIILDEAPLIAEGQQMVPVDRIFIARRIRDEFGPDVAGCVMDNHYIFRMH